MWNDLFKNATCANDVPLDEVLFFKYYKYYIDKKQFLTQVDSVLLDKMCPTSNCRLYEDFSPNMPTVEPISVPAELQSGLLISQSGTYSYQLPPSKVYLFLVSIIVEITNDCSY